MIRPPRRTLALIVVCAALGTALAWRLLVAQSPLPAASASAEALTVAVAELEEPPRAVDLAVVGAQPVFHKTRQFVRPADTGAPELRPPPPSYQFAGALILPGKPPIAYLKHVQSSQPLKIKVGELVEGWTVSAIEARSVALEFAGETIMLGVAPARTGGLVPVAPRAARSEPAGGLRILTAPSQGPSTVSPPLAAKPLPQSKPRTYQPPPST